jgi:thiol-disulfide isomerase/thioredoxin
MPDEDHGDAVIGNPRLGDVMSLAYHKAVTWRIVFVFMVAGLLAGMSLLDAEPAALPDVTLQTIDGKGSVTLDEFRGRTVLLTFWASWCGPCRVELPELQKLYAELAGEGFVLLTVNVDTIPEMGVRFLDQIGVTIPMYRMNQRDLVALGINALPTNIVLDHDGVVVQVYRGYSPAVPEYIRHMVLETDDSTREQPD